jgi:hypothetical protein
MQSRGMRCVEHIFLMEEMHVSKKTLERKDHLGDPGVDGCIILIKVIRI